jgi:hypothetical protein
MIQPVEDVLTAATPLLEDERSEDVRDSQPGRAALAPRGTDSGGGRA